MENLRYDDKANLKVWAKQMHEERKAQDFHKGIKSQAEIEWYGKRKSQSMDKGKPCWVWQNSIPR